MAQISAAVGNAWEQTKKVHTNALPKMGRFGADLINDPARTTVAVGTSGGSETYRATGVEAEQAIEREMASRAPKMEALPGSGGDMAPVETKDPDAARARGRASTILTGRRGLSGTPQTARRTLLGV